MKVYLKFANPNLIGPVSRTILHFEGEIVDHPANAHVIMCDRWIYPADTAKTYLYTITALEDMKLKGAFHEHNILREFPQSLLNYPNAFYIGHQIQMFEGLARQEFPETTPHEEVVVVVDDNVDNLNAITGIPNTIAFSNAEAAVSFIQLGTRKIACVLTDMRMPLPSANYRGDHFVEAQDKQAGGILVCFAASKRNIPVAVVTTGHHGSPIEDSFTYVFAPEENIPIVHTGKIKEAKDWITAYRLLIKDTVLETA